jgi:hypothetical protein
MSGRLSLAAGRGHRFRKGDAVELQTPAEILATLDEDGCLDGVPFMPEMLRYLGRRFTVNSQVERACDTINQTGAARRMPDAVLLDDLRCDGSAHGGCQAGCRLYWKEAWLRPASAESSAAATSGAGAESELEQLARRNTESAGGEGETYRCQATEFLRATEETSYWDHRSFLRELTCGNVGLWRFLTVCARLGFDEIGLRLGLRSDRPVRPCSNGAAASPGLDLKPGELVQVRSKDEIAQTLREDGKNRGLWFDREMLPYCGTTHAIKTKVERFVDEGSGRMVELESDCFILDGVVCSGCLSRGRWFCQRQIYSWWRECWLLRTEEPCPADAPRRVGPLAKPVPLRELVLTRLLELGRPTSAHANGRAWHHRLFRRASHGSSG